jgi:hypothetical protein
MAVYGINYAEAGSKQLLNYESVRIHYGKDEEKLFNSGNFVKDWFDLIKYIIMELSNTEPHFVGSSDVDHFFMDGADELYDEAYLVTDEKGVSELCYGNFENIGIKLYVPKGTKPTWKELKEMCK